MKCIHCNGEAIYPMLDEYLKVCRCLLLHKRDGTYAQYHRDGTVDYLVEKEERNIS
jgi:hypothetical protein